MSPFETIATTQHEQTKESLDRIEKTAGELLNKLENSTMNDERDLQKLEAAASIKYFNEKWQIPVIDFSRIEKNPQMRGPGFYDHSSRLRAFFARFLPLKPNKYSEGEIIVLNDGTVVMNPRTYENIANAVNK